MLRLCFRRNNPRKKCCCCLASFSMNAKPALDDSSVSCAQKQPSQPEPGMSCRFNLQHERRTFPGVCFPLLLTKIIYFQGFEYIKLNIKYAENSCGFALVSCLQDLLSLLSTCCDAFIIKAAHARSYTHVLP